MTIKPYKGYSGTITYVDDSDGVYYGVIKVYDDLVTFQADTKGDVQHQFESAVDDYIEFCKKIGKTLNQPKEAPEP